MKTLPIFLYFCLFCLFQVPCGQGEEARPHKDLASVAVHVQTAKETSTQPQVEMVATIEAVEQAAIAAKITGTLIDLPVLLGSRVNKGDVLAKISAEEISARVQRAQAQLAQAQRNLSREQKLLKRNATTKETVNSLRDIFTVTKASLQEAKTMLGYTIIRAPFTGVVTQKLANSGDLATPGTPLLQLENDTRLQAVTAVPESLIHLIKGGDKLLIKIPSAQLTLTGTVAEIAPAANPQTRTAPVKIDIDSQPLLRTGQFARVLLPVAQAKTLLLQRSAVISFGQMDRVFVVEEGKAQLRLVRTGSESKDQVEILAGISEGEQVIVDNNSLLVSGQPVTVIQ